MCGIAGFVSSEKLHDDEMINSLSHRGPDHIGKFYDSRNTRKVFLGHARLSILDLSEKGNQPMFSTNKQFIIIFNGEVYNFEEVKLKYFKTEAFHSGTDTEVILKLYEKFGINFISELNGDFAISIYDKLKGKMFLIRDRVGVKPLYYYFDQDKFVFGSEIKAIIAAGIKPVLAEEHLLSYFVFKYVPKNNTLHKNIFRVAPGSYIEYNINTNELTNVRYWELKKNPAYGKLSYKEAEKILFDLVSDSIRMRLIADVPVGNFLSGGLDSSIIAYFLKGNKNISHYCAKKSESDLKKEGTTSDFYYAEKLAREWDLNLLHADIGSGEANADLIKKTLFYSDDLIADGSQIPSYLITKEASGSSKVILSGIGADELFLGYAGQLLTMICTNWLDKFPKFISKPLINFAASVNQGKGKFLSYRRYIHKIGKYYKYPDYKYGLYNIVGDFENSCSVYSGDKKKMIELFSGYFPGNQNPFDSIMHFEMENFLVKNLHYTDRMAMANSVECRVPFLDHRIIEFAYSIPREYKLTNFGKSKRIMKDAFKSQLPPYILKRRKAGFGMPLRSIFSEEKNINALLDRAFFSSFQNFSIPDIEKVINNHVSGKEDNSSIIYALISFQEWYKMNFK
jgi:asparagine synthase (glutamine-hydrolysing)